MDRRAQNEMKRKGVQMKITRILKDVAQISAALIIVAVLSIGCSRFDSPTASQPTVETEMGLWAPNPGDQIIPGHEVPILNANYWETAAAANGTAVEGVAMIPPRAMRIGPQGGVVYLGFHQLIIPAGAVSDYVLITLTNASTNAVAVDCSPTPFRFNAPVTLVLSYKGTQYETSLTASSLSVVYMADNSTFEPLPSVVDAANLTVSAQTDHFSRYIIG
jgi:hypothetical protein